MQGDAERYFFVHIMRTGGGTLTRQFRKMFGPGEVYPDTGLDGEPVKAKMSIDHFRSVSPERHESVRLYSAHLPYFVTEMVPGLVRTMTMLRDPVERTTSHLMMKLGRIGHPMSPADLYEFDGQSAMLRNFQTRQFAATAEDGLRRSIDQLDIDDDRLALAKENLAKIDVLGFQDRSADFKAQIEARFGWRLPEVDDVHGSPPMELPDAFVERVREDNAMDLAFYAHALDLAARRRAQVRPSGSAQAKPGRSLG